MSANGLPLDERGMVAQLEDVWPTCGARDEVGAFATFTDEEWGGTLEELLECLGSEGRLARLLELRVFEPARELHAVRDGMGTSFAWRCAGEEDGRLAEEGLTFDDEQLLDIDASEGTRRRLLAQDPSGRTYKSISGGSYRLPTADAERILLRNYLAFDEDGLAHVVDFRVVRLLRKGE